MLLNPRIIEAAGESDEQYEGCLSFFDVRCLVPRSLAVQVEHRDVDGGRRIMAFEGGVARLVAHEIDHLEGVLCRDRMHPGIEPVPVERYGGSGQGWRYPQDRPSGRWEGSPAG